MRQKSLVQNPVNNFFLMRTPIGQSSQLAPFRRFHPFSCPYSCDPPILRNFACALQTRQRTRRFGDSHLHFLRSSVFQRFWVFRSRTTCPGIAVDRAAITRDLSRRSRGSRRFPSRDLRKSVQSV